MRRMHRPLLLLSALILATGCTYNERVDAILELTPDSANGAVIWAADCESCHGADGLGTELGPDLIGELHHGDEQFLTWILDGKDGEMPAFPDYTDQEAADVLEHIHVLAE